MLSEGPALRLSGVTRRFGKRWVLRGIDLDIEAGRVVALMGRNGSGKTTLLRIAATLLRPTRGQGHVFGHDLVAGAPDIREFVGTLGHHAGIYDDLTADENLRFSLRMAGLPSTPARIEAALEAVGLATERLNRVRGFSAGMRRRLALGRLMLRPPRLLLLDEPYAAFDQPGIDLVNRFARSIADGGGIAIVATHDLARARTIADRVVHIDRGLLLEGSTPELAPDDHAQELA